MGIITDVNGMHGPIKECIIICSNCVNYSSFVFQGFITKMCMKYVTMPVLSPGTTEKCYPSLQTVLHG